MLGEPALQLNVKSLDRQAADRGIGVGCQPRVDTVCGASKRPTLCTFMFWNLRKNPLTRLVTQLVSEESIDVLVLAECRHVNEIVEALNQAPLAKTYRKVASPVSSTASDTVIVSHFPAKFWKPARDNGETSIRRLCLPLSEEILVATTHLGSKLYLSDDDQAQLVTRLPQMISAEETRRRHTRTLLIGDLNMNPFESGVVGSEGLHAVASRRIVMEVDRTVSGTARQFFYNPMWRFFGERAGQPGGTYFYRSSKPVMHFWNIFDQVLIRPALLPKFRDESLKIVNSIGGASLLTHDGRPDKDSISDHLPVVFTLDIN